MSHGRELPRTRVAVVLVEDDQVLLVRHSKRGESYWLLPGGGLDYGEGIAECARREIREETGLEIEVERFLYLSEAIAPDRSRHILNITVLGRLAGGTLELAQGDIMDAVQWFPFAELAGLTLYPAIQAELLASHTAGFQHEMKYLGSIWT
jgi:ADP-ribose pyrophosphatase YjhB (NUDIX family)